MVKFFVYYDIYKYLYYLRPKIDIIYTDTSRRRINKF